MARVKVLDPEGQEWFVWRRWYVWRRWVTLRDVWEALPGTSGDGRSGGSELDDLLSLPLFLLALLGLGASLLDLAVQLIALPFALVSRTLRLTSWPVQVDRASKHVRTLRVRGFVAAGALRDEQVALVGAGEPGSARMAA